MRAIMTGEDVGQTIDFRRGGTHQARHPWPDETVVSAGARMLRPAGDERRLFVEVYPPGEGCIRGQGSTPAECEDSAWAKYQLALHCDAEHDEHLWEPRDYVSGAGVCAHCGTFKSGRFTGEQLGQHCRECGAGTTHAWVVVEGEKVFTCPEHTPPDTRSDEEVFADFFGTITKTKEG